MISCWSFATFLSNPQSWIKFSDANIERATQAKFKSVELRGSVTGLLSSACLEMMTAWSISNRSFKERVAETEQTQKQLQASLAETAEEIQEMDEHIRWMDCEV